MNRQRPLFCERRRIPLKDRKQILAELDAAIEEQNLDAIERGLEALSQAETHPIAPEDPMVFCAAIKKLDKEQRTMKKPIYKIAIVAAAVALLSVGVYAASALNLFSFRQGDRFVTMRTTESMTEQEARELVEGDASAREENTAGVSQEAVGQADVEEFTFATPEQAAAKLDLKLPLPAAMPELPLSSATGSVMRFGENYEDRTVWLNYGDPADKAFGVTVIREILPEGEAVTSYTTHDMDEGSLGRYKSKSGTEYTILSESNEDGSLTAHIATTMMGEYEYSLVFVGFSQAERNAVIDSTDLSSLRG